MSIRVQPKYVAGDAGNLFVLEYQPNLACCGTILFVPPFAEEMNRARRMVSLQANILAEIGYHVIVPDLYGTGDSDGDFEDARWPIWRNDLAAVLAASDACSAAQVSIWGLRLGAMLALDALNCRIINANRAIIWSPCVSGEQFVTQFLRMRTMAGMITAADNRESIADLRLELEASGSLEVAGYMLSHDLVSAIQSLKLDTLIVDAAVPVDWFEMVSKLNGPFPKLSDRIASRLIEQGKSISTFSIEGPAFWSTPEISTSPQLLAAMSALLSSD